MKMDQRYITLIGTALVVAIAGLEVDHWGTQFVFSFLKCGRSETSSSNIVVVTAREDTNVYVLFAETGQSWTFSLTEANFEVLNLGFTPTAEPYGSILPNKSVLIQASKPVSVYGYSNRTEYSDGFLALPVVGLGYKYLVVNIDGGERSVIDSGPQIVIAAPYDDTKVQITLFKENVCIDSLGELVFYKDGHTVVIGMKALDVFNLYCESHTTGAIISSSHPIAVLTGSARVPIPYYADEDHVVEMLPPIASFGKEWVIKAPTQNAGDSMIRIAVTDITNFSISTSDKTQQLAAQSYHDEVLEPGQNVCIQSKQPMLVVMFLRGINSTNTYVGDAFMMVIPPVSKFTNDYVIHAAALWGFDNFMYVIGLTTQVESIHGLHDTSTFSQMPECPLYSSSIMEFKWVRRLNSSNEFMILMFGVKLTEGYGFPGGMKLVPFSDIDHCGHNPCLNDGWCLNGLKTYTCHCPSEYTGLHCEDQISKTRTATEVSTSTAPTTTTTTTEVPTSTVQTTTTTTKEFPTRTVPTTTTTTREVPISTIPTTTTTTTEVPTSTVPTTTTTTTEVPTSTVPTTTTTTTTTEVPTSTIPTTTTTTTEVPTSTVPTTTTTITEVPTSTIPTTTTTTTEVPTSTIPTTTTTTTEVPTSTIPTTTTTTTETPTSTVTTTTTTTTEVPTSTIPATTVSSNLQNGNQDGGNQDGGNQDGGGNTYADTKTTDSSLTNATTTTGSVTQTTQKDVPATDAVQDVTSFATNGNIIGDDNVGGDLTTIPTDDQPTQEIPPVTESYSTTETLDTNSESSTNTTIPTIPTTTNGEKYSIESYSTTETLDFISDSNPTVPTTEIQISTEDGLDATTENGETESYSTTKTQVGISDSSIPTTTEVTTEDGLDATTENGETESYSTTKTQVGISDSSITTTAEVTTEGLGTTITDQSNFDEPKYTLLEETVSSSTEPYGETSTTKLQDQTSEYISTTISHPSTTAQPVQSTIRTIGLTNRGNVSYMCACPCAKNLNNSEISTLLENQKKFLKVEKETLSQTIRQKQSSENIIQSETNLGVASVLLVTFLISGIIAIDLTRVYAWLRETWCIESKISDTRRMIGSNNNL